MNCQASWMGSVLSTWVSVSFSRKNLLHEALVKKKLTDISQPNFLELTTMSVLVLPTLQVCISLPRLSSQVFITFKYSSKQGDIYIYIYMLATCHSDTESESPICSLLCTKTVFQIMLHRGYKILSIHLQLWIIRLILC